MLAGIGAALQIIWGVLSFFLEKNSDKKKRKKEALKGAFDGIEAKDPSAVTAAINDLNNA
jgi:hypothetical protein